MTIPAAASRAEGAAERPLTLADAIRMALEHSDAIVVERESVRAAEAGVTGAEGAYDPLFSAEAAWTEANPPVNSAFSGAPAGRLSPETEQSALGLRLDQLLPTGGVVSLRAGGDRTSTDGLYDLLSPAWGTSTGVEIRQPLLRNLAIDPARFAVRAAASDRAGAEASFERLVSENVAAVEQAYWSLVAARREIAVREEAVRLAEEQLSETTIRIETGDAPELEIAQPRSELERRRGERIAAEETTLRAENRLKLLILADGDPALWADRLVPAEDSEVRPSTIDTAAAMARALDRRPELAAAAARLDRRRLETALAGNALRPSLDAVASYDRYGLAGEVNGASSPTSGSPVVVPPALDGDLGTSFDRLRDGDFEDKRLALVFSVPLGNRTARAGRDIARSAERQAEADLSRLRKAIRVEVLDAAAVLDTAGQRIEAARAAREAAETQLGSERERYAAGMSTNFLVLTRQNDLSAARLDEIAAQTDYRRASTELARVTGALLSERGIDLIETRDGRGTDPQKETKP